EPLDVALVVEGMRVHAHDAPGIAAEVDAAFTREETEVLRLGVVERDHARSSPSVRGGPYPGGAFGEALEAAVDQLEDPASDHLDADALQQLDPGSCRCQRGEVGKAELEAAGIPQERRQLRQRPALVPLQVDAHVADLTR